MLKKAIQILASLSEILTVRCVQQKDDGSCQHKSNDCSKSALYFRNYNLSGYGDLRYCTELLQNWQFLAQLSFEACILGGEAQKLHKPVMMQESVDLQSMAVHV